MKTINPFEFSDTNKRYYTYDYYLKRRFGGKCFKVPLDGGFTCPNRDGSKGTGGCTYCSERGSGDFTCTPDMSITKQFEICRNGLLKKWPSEKYIAYFQAFTGTYAPTERLRELFEEALSQKGVVGLSVATRGDCVTPETAQYLKELSKRTFLTVELGLQSVHDETAKRINRCHTYAEFLTGYNMLDGVNRCIHIINGLPGENREMMMQNAKEVAKLHPEFLKIHLLHVLRGTTLAKQYESGEFDVMTREEYTNLVCDQLEIMPPDTVIGRVTGDGAKDALIAPLWSLKKFVVMNEIDKELVRRGTYQGIYYGK